MLVASCLSPHERYATWEGAGWESSETASLIAPKRSPPGEVPLTTLRLMGTAM